MADIKEIAALRDWVLLLICQAPRMERRTKALHATIRPVKLYLDDVQAIYDILAEGAQEGEVKIATEDYVLEHVDQLANHGSGPITGVEITSRDLAGYPFIFLRIEPEGVRLHAHRDDLVSSGAYNKTLEIVMRRRRWFHWLVGNNLVSFTAPYLALAWGALLVGFGFSDRGLSLILGLALAAGALAWFGVNFFFHDLKGGVVVPVRRTEAPSFLRRNKDQIVLAVFSALLGAALAFVVVLLTN